MSRATRSFRSVRPWYAGVLLLVVGAVFVVAGLVQTTVSHGGNENCPSGTTLVAKFEFSGGKYVFEGPDANAGVVHISNGSSTGGGWQSTTPISFIVVKGGPGAVVTSLSSSQTSGHFSNAGLPKVGIGNTPAVSNVQFCGATGPPNPTTTTSIIAPPNPTTTTSVARPPTTTTPTFEPATTTSTVEPSGRTVPSTSRRTVPRAATSTSVYRNASTLPSGQLPRTGSSSGLLVAIGVVLVGAGLGISVTGFRRDRGRARP
jgi:LPXTG-motif cell wall-anchored protein